MPGKRTGHVSDKDRWSWITPDFNYCFMCSATNVPLEKHEVYGGTANRQKSKDHGCVVSLCPRCHRLVHSNREYDLRLKRTVEKMYLVKYGKSVEDFIAIFHRNYLGEDDVRRGFD